MEQIRRIMRPTDVPDQGLLCDLLWSDPDKDTMGWGENDRGVSFTFGAEVNNLIFLISTRLPQTIYQYKTNVDYTLFPVYLFLFCRLLLNF